MRKIVVFVALFSMVGCAQHHVVQSKFDPNHIHHYSEFKHFDDVKEFSDRVAYLDQGDIIPLKMSFQSEWFGIQQDHVDLVVKRKIYFRVTFPKDIDKQRLETILSLDSIKLDAMSEAEKTKLFEGVMLYASKDAVLWAPLNSMGAIKEVFGISGGCISLGVGMNITEGLWTALSVKTMKAK